MHMPHVFRAFFEIDQLLIHSFVGEQFAFRELDPFVALGN